MTEDELKEELSKIGTIEVFKNSEIFTLFLRAEVKGTMILDVMKLVLDTIIDKPITEVIKNDDDFILIILKKKDEA